MPILILLLALLVPLAPAQTLPSGFVDEPLVTGLDRAVGLSILPDGRVLFAEHQSGDVFVWAQGQTALIGTVPNVSFGVWDDDRGLGGITLDPLWPQWPYLYVHTTDVSGQILISRFTLQGAISDPLGTALSLGDRYDILAAPDQHDHHNGGTVAFGPDGMLYVSLGDDRDACGAHDPTILNGAILRLDVAALRGLPGPGLPPQSMLVPAGNPFTGTNAQLVWAYGLRSPFRFDIDLQNGALYVGDVGTNRQEEISVISGGGGNYGWPFREGTFALNFPCVNSGTPMIDPILTWGNPGGASALSFGGRYRNQPGGIHNFGPAYEGDLFVTDFFQAFVKRLKEGPGGSWSIAPAVAGQGDPASWATGIQFASDAEVGPDGALYYTRLVFPHDGELRRIRPAQAAAQLAILDGDAQPGNAAHALPLPLRVQVRDLSSAPLSGVPVSFEVSAGSGALSAPIVLSDASGIAAVNFTLDAIDSSDPRVRATIAGHPPVEFTITWRGLVVAQPAPGALDVSIRHSQGGAPVLLAADIPQPAPWFVHPQGAIWTSFLDPQSTAIVLDGFGLSGPADPSMVCDVNGTWSLQLTGLPTLGTVSLLLQGYSLDTAAGIPWDLMISQPVTVVF